jgi:hypothetical protein
MACSVKGEMLIRSARWIAVIAAALIVGFGELAEAQGSKSGGPHKGGKAVSHMSSKGIENTNAQWSADPERGWVRAEERHEQHDQSQAADRSKEEQGRHKGRGVKGGSIVWDY